MNSSIRFNHMGPQFAVKDIGMAVGFYAAVLAFGLDYLDGEAPLFMPGAGRAFVAVSGIDAIWERAKSEAPDAIVQPLEDLDYGQAVRFRVFAVADPSGNTLRIGEPLADTSS